VGWVGFGQSADGLGWIGLHKMDPRTTLFSSASVPKYTLTSCLQQVCVERSSSDPSVDAARSGAAADVDQKAAAVDRTDGQTDGRPTIT